MRVVEVMKVGGINGGTGKQSRGKRIKGLGRIFEQWCVRTTMTADEVSTKAGGLDNFVGSTFAVRQFGDSAGGGVAVDLDSSHDEIADSKGNGGMGFVGALAVEGTAFLGQ